MADNPPAPNTGPLPPLPSSGATGRLKSPTTQLPIKKGGAGKIVVMLSSVAKLSMGNTQALPKAPAPSATQALPTPVPESAPVASTPAPLPPAQVAPAKNPRIMPPSKLTSTTYVKLPPKTSIPQLSTLSGLPITPTESATPAAREMPVNKAPEPTLPKKSGAQLIPPIKLNEPAATTDSAGESIFATRELAKVQGPTSPVENASKPAPPASSPEAKEKAAPPIAPPSLSPQRVGPSVPTAMTTMPMPSTLSKPAEAKPPGSVAAHPLHVAPPMLEQTPEPPAEKLPQPLLGSEVRKSDPPVSTSSTGVHKVPALVQPEAPLATGTPLAPAPKPLLPPVSSMAKATRNWLTKSIPLVLTSTTKLKPPVVVEAKQETKPSLKPATLPKRALPNPDGPAVEPSVTPAAPVKALETSKPAKAPVTAKSDVTAQSPELPKAAESVTSPEPPKTSEPVKLPEPAVLAPVVVAKVEPTLVKAEEKTPVSALEKEKGKIEVKPDAKATSLEPLMVPLVTKTTEPKKLVAKKSDAKSPEPKKGEPPPLPLTRAARAAKRRRWETVIFYVLFVITMGALFLGGLHFGRDTRLEGQVIPPTGMKLNDEVWIVTDFSSLASGIADDLAKERMPLLQEVQERQEHVQRAQADVASRESRIRLIQDQITAAKNDISAVIKQSRDATQEVWDKDGAAMDDEYNAKLNQLQEAIASRAKANKLNYQPDPAYKSPEVWANAYRLALYQVPAGVDSVKELQWLGGQMKEWRDYQKTLDDQQEQLREKAAQIKLGPAPKITDLNAKIEDLQQRSDSTEAEEVPLKAELQQAQIDLAAAQASVAGLDDKYYAQLDSLPKEAITKHIPLATNGRFTWVEDDSFAQGETERHYWIFSRATRADGRQYWALHHFGIGINQTVELYIEPSGFVSTKSILRPDLSPEEQAE